MMAVITIPADMIETVEAQTAQDRARTVAVFQSAIQAHVDSIARSKSYADGNACASYVASTVSGWAAESQAFVAWRAVWTYAYAELDKVQSGEREQPPVEAFIAELPTIGWL
jgi:hypothetical protein